MVGYEKLNFLLLEDWRGMQMQLKFKFLCHELVNTEDAHNILFFRFG